MSDDVYIVSAPTLGVLRREDEMSLNILRRYLTSVGFEYTIVSSGEEAIAGLRESLSGIVFYLSSYFKGDANAYALQYSPRLRFVIFDVTFTKGHKSPHASPT